jgi:hypothetical protein
MTKHHEWTPAQLHLLETMWIEGRTYESIAQKFGCTVKTITHKLRSFAASKQSMWTPERTAMLARWAEEGFPLSKMAELISREIGYAVSRSSVAGRCNRAGITIQSFEAQARRHRQRRQQDLATGAARLASVVLDTPPHDSLRSVGSETGEEESVAASSVSIEDFFEETPVDPNRVTIIQLTGLMCKWVTEQGHGDVLPAYCGDPVVFNRFGNPGVYCRDHHARAYLSAPKMKEELA